MPESSWMNCAVDWDGVLIVTAVGGVMSILTGIITWWVTRSRERLDETRRMQRDLLTQLVGNRHHLKGDLFTQALNSCAVVFSESSDVQMALQAFHARAIAEHHTTSEIESALLGLIRAMIGYLGLRIRDLPDDFLLRPFNTHADSALPPAPGTSAKQSN